MIAGNAWRIAQRGVSAEKNSYLFRSQHSALSPDMKRIAVLTSGGDPPGMNPAIRAVVRMGHAAGLQVFGVERGYQGLMDGSFHELSLRDVGGIIGRGGTILQSARCLDMKTLQGRERVRQTLNARGIEGLIVIGGNGSHAGAYEIYALGFPVVTIRSTIDNDVCFTDVTIGVDTALNHHLPRSL